MTQRKNTKHFKNQFIDQHEVETKAFTDVIVSFIPSPPLSRIVMGYLNTPLPITQYNSGKESGERKKEGLAPFCVFEPVTDCFHFCFTKELPIVQTTSRLWITQQYQHSGLKFRTVRDLHPTTEIMPFHHVQAKFSPEDNVADFLLELEVDFAKPPQTFSFQYDLSTTKRDEIAIKYLKLKPEYKDVPAPKEMHRWINQTRVDFRGANVSLLTLVDLFLITEGSLELGNTATSSVTEYQHWLAFGQMLERVIKLLNSEICTTRKRIHDLYFSYLASVHWVNHPLFNEFKLLVKDFLEFLFLELFKYMPDRDNPKGFAQNIIDSFHKANYLFDLLSEPGVKAGEYDNPKFYAEAIEEFIVIINIKYRDFSKKYSNELNEVLTVATLFQEPSISNSLKFSCLKLFKLLFNAVSYGGSIDDLISFTRLLKEQFSKSSLTTASVKMRLKTSLETSSQGNSKADAKGDASNSSSEFRMPFALSHVASRVLQNAPSQLGSPSSQPAFFEAKRTSPHSFDTLWRPTQIAHAIHLEPAAARQVFIRDLFAYFDAKPAKELFEDTHAKFYFKILRAYIEMNSIEKDEQEAVIKFLDAITMRQANSPLLKGLYVSVMIMMESGDENRLRFINTLLAKRHDAAQEKMCVEKLRKTLCHYLPPEMMVRMVDQLDTHFSVDLLSQYATEFLATQSGLVTSEAVLEIGLAVWECQAISNGASLKLKI